MALKICIFYSDEMVFCIDVDVISFVLQIYDYFLIFCL